MTAAPSTGTAGDRSIVLGVGGGIAAYKSCILLRLLIEAGHRVTVVPTEAALQFVGATTWSALSGNDAATSPASSPADGSAAPSAPAKS